LAALALAAAISCKGAGCGHDDEKPAAADKPVPESVTLRFRPLDKLGYREHWVYDVDVPGDGLGRNALSLDVALLAKLDQDAFAVRETVLSHVLLRDKQPVPGPSLVGAAFTYSWGRDHSLVSELVAEAPTPQLTAAAKLVAQLARFGTLIEYPDQTVAVGDSWSIEPRQLPIIATLEATLRPTYTLEGLDRTGGDRAASIASDIQVDVPAVPLAEGITVEGGGTASGTLRVRVRDGVLLEARSVMHFSQEITVSGNEILGYREFSATAHVFTTPATASPNLESEPYTLEEPEHDRDCDLAVASALQRVKNLPSYPRVHPMPALRGVTLPSVPGGNLLRAPAHASALLVWNDTRHAELDGVALEPKDLAHALRGSAAPAVLYVYADAALTLERLHALLALVPARSELRLVVRDSQSATQTPKTLRWLDERLRLAAAAPNRDERDRRLHELLTAHLALCEPAVAVYQKAITDPAQWPALPSTLLSKFLGCGCTATSLDGLEATLEATLGSPDLRWLPLSHKSLPDTPAPTANLADLAKQLVGIRARMP
jgi:hypothetical protein